MTRVNPPTPFAVDDLGHTPRPPAFEARTAVMTQSEANKSKFAEFIAAKKLDTRRIQAASSKLENLRSEDRVIRLARRQKKAGGEGAKAAEEKAKGKPRSGRPVTDRAIAAALSGKKIAGPQKTRILKAVNVLLEQKKQDPATLDLLF